MKECPHCSHSCKNNHALNNHITGWHTTINCKICENEMTKFDVLLELNNISADEVTSSHLMNARIKYCSKECKMIASNKSTKKWRKANPEKTLESSRKNDKKKKNDPKRKEWEYEYYRRPEVKERNNQKQNYRYQNNINGKKDKVSAYSKRPDIAERRNRLAREKTAIKIKPVLQKVCEKCKCVFETTIPLSTRRWCTPKCRATAWSHIPHNRLNARISNSIRKILNPSIDKNNSSCFEYLDFTKEELISHFESYFTDESGYSWDNMSEWHIDHIRPVASFNFRTTECEDFKKCWALNNLQPLRAEDNLSKGDKWDGIINA